MSASPRVTPDEAVWNDCAWGNVSVLRRTAACHAITATFSYLAMSDEVGIAQGVNRAECVDRQASAMANAAMPLRPARSSPSE